MILHIRYTCSRCPKAYEIVHYVSSDLVKLRLLTLEQLCPLCDGQMKMNVSETQDSPLRLIGDSLYFLNQKIFSVRENQITLDLLALVKTGFSGMFIINGADTIKYLLDSISPSIKKVK